MRSTRSAIVAVVVLVLALSACSSDELHDVAQASFAPRSTKGSAVSTRDMSAGPTGTLRVTQVQTACCYTEGQVSFLSITGPSGAVIADRSFRPLASSAVLYSVVLPSATYEVVSYQRPCNGNCDRLGGPSDRCSALFEVSPGTLIAVVVLAPAKGCTMLIDPTVASEIPDEIALVGDRRDCGIDYSERASHRERACFADAFVAGLPAHVVTTTPPNYLDVVRFDNGVITVYRNTPGLAKTSTWSRQTCTGLKPDKTDGYELGGCGRFTPL